MLQQLLRARNPFLFGISLTLQPKNIDKMIFDLSLNLNTSLKESDGTQKETILPHWLIMFKLLLKCSFIHYQSQCHRNHFQKQKVFWKQWNFIQQDLCFTFVTTHIYSATIFKNKLLLKSFNQAQEWFHQLRFIQKEIILLLDLMIKRSCGLMKTLLQHLIKSSNISKRRFEGLTFLRNIPCSCHVQMMDRSTCSMEWSIQKL